MLKQGLQFDWDAVGTHIEGKPTGEAIKQHLVKVRKDREKAHLDNPPQWFKKRPRKPKQGLPSPQPTPTRADGTKREPEDKNDDEVDISNHEGEQKEAPLKKPKIQYGLSTDTNNDLSTTKPETGANKKKTKGAKALEENIKNAKIAREAREAARKMRNSRKKTATTTQMQEESPGANGMDFIFDLEPPVTPGPTTLYTEPSYSHPWEMPIPSVANTSNAYTRHENSGYQYPAHQNTTYQNTTFQNGWAQNPQVGLSHNHPELLRMPHMESNQMRGPSLGNFGIPNPGYKTFGETNFMGAFGVGYNGGILPAPTPTPTPPPYPMNQLASTPSFSYDRLLPDSNLSSFLYKPSYPLAYRPQVVQQDPYHENSSRELPIESSSQYDGNGKANVIEIGSTASEDIASSGRVKSDADADVGLQPHTVPPPPPPERSVGEVVDESVPADYYQSHDGFPCDTPFFPELFEN